ncbi:MULTISPECIES: hypothetical protein [unclassified Variovorax]|jgi:hypothetical protein|uniref:hypothetical protein n=1 Tax=unclassified Variovorax TaxID=663243 RepID=UPI0021BB063D|nr:hypothetical protein [Variovorax sp. CY25R-8]MCT8180426.1 hypothetical protein [Variovorax sp. CY25R-8]
MNGPSSALSLWSMVDALSAQIPFSAPAVARLLPGHLAEASSADDEPFRFFEGGPIRLGDGVEISSVDLRIRREPGHPGFLVIELQGRCVPLEEVRARHQLLSLTGVPRGRSPEEAITLSAETTWGRLSFGFKERRRDCLAYIVFAPH